MFEQFKKNGFIIALCFFSMLKTMEAQNSEAPQNHLLTWTSIKIQKEITKNLDVFIAPEVRTFSKEIDEYIGDLGLKYKISKCLDAAVTYRYSQEAKNKGGYKTNHRLAIDLKTSRSYGDFDPEFRLRFTNKYDVNDNEQRRNLRFKGNIDYDIPKSKITPYLHSEIFYKLIENQWSKYRLGMGASIKISKPSSLQLGYILEKEWDSKDNEHIISLSYRFKF